MKRLNIVIALLFSTSLLLAQNGSEMLRLLEVQKMSALRVAMDKAKTANDAETLFYLGEVFYNLGNLDSARWAYQKGNPLNEKFYLNRLGLAKLNYQTGDTTAVAEEVETCIDKTKNKDAMTVAKAAEVYYRGEKKDQNKAIAIIKSGMEKIKKNWILYMALGDIYSSMGNASLSNENFFNATAFNPKASRAYFEIGKIYVKIKNYTEAETTFNDLLANDPEYTPVFLELADMYYNMKQLDKSIAMTEKFLATGERTPEGLRKLISLAFLNKQYASVVKVAGELEAMLPNDSYAAKLRAYAYYETGDSANGVSAFEKYFKLADQSKLNSVDYENYGRLLLKTGKDQAGIEMYHQAVKLDSNRTADLFGEIAVIYIKAKNYKETVKSLETKIAYSKKGVVVNDYMLLARAYYFDSNYVNAAKYFTKVTELAPKVFDAYLFLARSNVALDPESDEGKARPAYEKVYELGTAEPEKYKKQVIEAGAYLGYQWYLISQTVKEKLDKEKVKAEKDKLNAEMKDALAKSKEYWLKVKELDPENEAATAALKTFK